jgi:5-methylcytosine-specific restriction enzyme B
MSTFTWKPIYSELATALHAWRTRQSDLIEILHFGRSQGIPMAALQDKGKDGKSFPLRVIDPFTFFSFFNRIKGENRIKLLTIIKDKLNLASVLPSDFEGVPVTNPQNSWFFSYEQHREPHAIDTLWDFAKEITEKLPPDVSPQLFGRALDIRRVGLAQLTMGLFWMRPDHYLAVDKRNRALLKKHGIEPNITDWPSYLHFLNQVKAQIPGLSWSEFSLKAYQGGGDKLPEKRHWLFQANPQYFDLVGSLKVGALQTWLVKQHRKEVHSGDRLILWLSGSDAGVYALATVTSEVGELQESPEEAAFQREPSDTSKPFIGVTVRVDAAFCDTPIRKEVILKHEHTKALPIGRQGTNFPVTEKQFNAVEQLRKLLGITLDGSLQPPPPPPNYNPVTLSGLNTILYGPPGTGKTFNTIERAVRTIDPQFTGNHASHKARFDELRRKGQIEFITLHQSYSYEDFVEGLRPVTDPEEESTGARYRYCPGVFKRIAVQALFDCLKPTSPDAGAVSFDAVWNKLVEQIELAPEKSYPGLTEKTSYRISLTPKGNLEGVNTISNKNFLCPRSILEKVYAAKPTGKSISSSEVMEIVVRGCHPHFIAAVFNELKRLEKSLPAAKQALSAATFSWEQKAEVVHAFLKGRAAGAYALKEASEWPRYALVIDEINRGNVSKILGELITLIEPDKRVGAEHSLIVQLPYTQEYFAVPGNLHIIGTMNTADKSIALVDVALRRRFQFEELRPNFDYCANLTPQMRNALQMLNRRICLRKDRDHQIGHSYFMDVSNEAGFNRIFDKHVIPLLQEYFYNDWEGLRFVLGEKNKNGTFIKPLDGCEGAEARTKWQWAADAGNNGASNCFQALLANYQTT